MYGYLLEICHSLLFIQYSLLRDGGAQPPFQLRTVIFLWAASLDLLCKSCQVIFYYLTRDIEDSYTAMRMPSTTDSRISEMAVVGQPFNL